MEREESDLYGLALDEFVPARTELEKALRKEGDRERAAAVKKLPKPTVAAWAVNQASRSQPKYRRELIAASEALREAQEALIAGDASAADLDAAAGRQRAAIDALVDAASGLLTSDGRGLGEATLARVRETLAAVAADAELAELVDAGTLDRERRSAGLGFGFGGLVADDAPAEPAPAREKAARAREREVRAARERVKDAKTDEKGAAKRRKAAERDAVKAAEGLQRAEAAVAEARARVEAAREELEAAATAEEEAAAARQAAEAELDALG